MFKAMTKSQAKYARAALARTNKDSKETITHRVFNLDIAKML
jgi:hypothetical protein